MRGFSARRRNLRLADRRLSVTIPFVPFGLADFTARGELVRTKAMYWAGLVVFLSLVSIPSADAQAATPKKKTTRTAASKTTTAPAASEAPKKRTTLYSAERSLTRKATLARARALANARELSEPLPRQKVDATGGVVPDLRAAAAIIYSPETNQVLWEENSQSQRSI